MKNIFQKWKQQLKFAFMNWEDEVELKCVKIDETGYLPTKAHSSDSCYDLYLAKPLVIEPLQKSVADLKIAIQFPEGYGGQIRPRSSVELNNNILIHNGTIDNEYIGNLKIIVSNYGNVPVQFKRGDRIAQLFIESVLPSKIKEVEKLKETKRGENGLGSTGE